VELNESCTVGTSQHVPLLVYHWSSQHWPLSVVRYTPPQQLPDSLHSPSQQNPVGREYSVSQQSHPVQVWHPQHELHDDPSIAPIGYIAAA
jgi:hypothetical protein